MYYYNGILFVVLREWWISYISIFAGNLLTRTNDQGLTKLTWECCISYSTAIVVVFRFLKTAGGYFQQVETDVDFIISEISPIFNDNC